MIINKNIIFVIVIGLFLGISGCTKSIDDAESLYRSGQEEAALEAAEGLMNHEEPKVRQRAVRLIGKIGNEKAGQLLVRALRDSNSSVQTEAVRGLGANQYEPGIRPILDILPSADPDVVQAAGPALASYGSDALKLLVDLYSMPSQKSNRGVYRQVLMNVGASASEALIATLKGKSFFENRDTFALLEQMRNPRVATLMLPYLENEEVQEQVSVAIGRLGSMAINPTLDSIRKYMKSPDDVRVLEFHIKILGTLKDPRSVETLESLSQHPSERIRDSVDRALFQIRGF